MRCSVSMLNETFLVSVSESEFLSEIPRKISSECRATSEKLCQTIKTNERWRITRGAERLYSLCEPNGARISAKFTDTEVHVCLLRAEKTDRKPHWLKPEIELREDLFTFVEIYWKVQKKLLIYTDWEDRVISEENFSVGNERGYWLYSRVANVYHFFHIACFEHVELRNSQTSST